jgi:hypothetical protein
MRDKLGGQTMTGDDVRTVFEQLLPQEEMDLSVPNTRNCYNP